MADTGEVATLLHEFIEMVDSQARSTGFETQVSAQPKPPSDSRHRRLEILEQRLSKLDPDDCEQFRRLLKEMHEAS